MHIQCIHLLCHIVYFQHVTLLCSFLFHSLSSIFQRTQVSNINVVRIHQFFPNCELLYVLCSKKFHAILMKTFFPKASLLHYSYFHLQSIWNSFYIYMELILYIFACGHSVDQKPFIKKPILSSLHCNVSIVNAQVVYVCLLTDSPSSCPGPDVHLYVNVTPFLSPVFQCLSIVLSAWNYTSLCF